MFLRGKACRFNLRAVDTRLRADLSGFHICRSPREKYERDHPGGFSGSFNALYKHVYINVFLGWINSAFLFKF